MFTLTIESGEVRTQLAKLSQLPDDIPRVLDGIGQMLESRISGRFETEKDPVNVIWKRLNASTLKSYPKDGNRKVLNRHGDMLRSLNHQLLNGGNAVQVGFGAPYAVFHEFGTRKMPRRGLLFGDPIARTLAPNDEKTVLDALNDWLAGYTK
ncbi:phage virion morphogenesis protein [Rhodoferax aquaticus]|uniref:Virion morphogenesis protein n=1 Tax=Rhodoferax aquaticus TaxID=2527691 RepID=A0A515ERR5_9BURK|nr:phage virion morphogenesis protein [Rhodoferax aquaticus]QDL55339.1 virion morphogenesis protein [Rhodoferax aquaticus]